MPKKRRVVDSSNQVEKGGAVAPLCRIYNASNSFTLLALTPDLA
jgi:hypothetical protein